MHILNKIDLLKDDTLAFNEDFIKISAFDQTVTNKLKKSIYNILKENNHY